jgi:hypothetical protein
VRPRALRNTLLLAAGFLLVVLGAALVRPRVERAVRARVESEAARNGLVASLAAVRVGPWPPLRLAGVRLEKPGAWSFATDEIDVTLRPWGRGLLGRVRLSLAPVQLRAAAGMTIESAPTRWDVERLPPNGVGLRLRGSSGSLNLSWLRAADGEHLEADAANLEAGTLVTVRHDGAPLADLGLVDGVLRLTVAPQGTRCEVDFGGRNLRLASLGGEALGHGDAATFGQPTDVTLRFSGSWLPRNGMLDLTRWRLTAGGVVASGSLAVADIPANPRMDLSLDVERVDFARLLQTSGVDQPESLAARLSSGGEQGLGAAALTARVSGRLADPLSFTVSQHLDFRPPPRAPEALEKLRGPFVHEVPLLAGGRKAIVVGPESPDFLPLAAVPPLFVRTLLLAEDAGFYGHRGLDLAEVPAAILTNWSRGGAARGASTITQQLAKNLFLSREKKLSRKLQELCLALLLESTLGKERILEIYLNVIEWGPDLYGLRPAARRYFHKEPAELTPKQMAFLVTLIPGPVKYQRSFAGGTLVPGFRPLVDDLLAKVHSVQALSDEDYEAALAEELVVDTAQAQAPANASPP